jgi:hypothetical protein
MWGVGAGVGVEQPWRVEVVRVLEQP